MPLDAETTRTLSAALAQAIAEHTTISIWLIGLGFLAFACCYGASLIIKAWREK